MKKLLTKISLILTLISLIPAHGSNSSNTTYRSWQSTHAMGCSIIPFYPVTLLSQQTFLRRISIQNQKAQKLQNLQPQELTSYQQDANTRKKDNENSTNGSHMQVQKIDDQGLCDLKSADCNLRKQKLTAFVERELIEPNQQYCAMVKQYNELRRKISAHYPHYQWTEEMDAINQERLKLENEARALDAEIKRNPKCPVLFDHLFDCCQQCFPLEPLSRYFHAGRAYKNIIVIFNEKPKEHPVK